jgi:hypothetical protein
MKKFTKWFFIGLIALIVIAIGLYFYVAYLVKKEIYNQYDKTALSEYYALSINRIGYNIFTQNLIIHNLKLLPVEQSDSTKPAPPENSLKIKRIEVKQFDVNRLINEREIYTSKLLFHQPHLEIDELIKNQKLLTSKNNDSTPKQALKKIIVEQFVLEDGFIKLRNESNQADNIHLPSVNLKFEGIRVNFDSLSKKPNVGLSLATQLQVDSLSFRLPGTYYKLFINTSEILPQSQDLKFSGVKLYPIRGLHAQAVGLRKQNDVVEIDVKTVQTTEFDLTDLISGKGFFMEKLLLDEPTVRLMRDKRLPEDENKRPKMPQQLVRSIKGDFKVDTILLQNASIYYTELMGDKPDTPTINFDSVFTTITGFASLSTNDGNKRELIANSSGIILGKAHFENKINWHFTADNSFDFHGRLGGMNASAVNVVSESAAGALFRSGVIDSVFFKGLGNQDAASGMFEMRYHDLVVDVTQKRSNNPNKFLSLIANLILRRENPAEGEGIRQVQMQTVRVPYKGFFNMYWKTIENGLLNTLKPGKRQRMNKDDALRKEWERFKKEIAQ